MVIIDAVINTLFGGLTLDPAGMHCPSWDDAFVSSSSLWHVSGIALCLFQINTCCRMATSDSYGKKIEIWSPVKFKPLNRLSKNLPQVITSTRGTFIPSLVKQIRSRGTSGQIGEMSLSCDYFFLRDALWPILSHDGSKCTESRKDVPFGVKIFNFNIWPLFTLPKMSNFATNIAILGQNVETWNSKYTRNF